MSRITIKNLERLVETFNRETGSPMAYSTATNQPFQANVGHYHIDAAYGGYALVRTVNTSGGECTILIRGTAGDLYERMHAWLAGWRAAREQSQSQQAAA